MKIHSICLVKNEADIIEQTLVSATQWCDFIYVYDNGSTDGTWEKVLELAKVYESIIPYKQNYHNFNNCMRGEVFRHYRHRSQEGDWWCRLDADEIYIDDPRSFLAKVPPAYQLVWNASFQYFFTDKDLERYNQNPSLYADDVPVEQKCRYYLNNWSEARFFRYDTRLVWDENRRWPYLGAVYPGRIRLKHYQYRSPQQIQRRIDIRREAIAKGCNSFKHETRFAAERSRLVGQAIAPSTVVITQPDVAQSTATPARSVLLLERSTQEEWKERIVPAASMNYDAHDGNYVLREDLMPKLPQVPLVGPALTSRMRILKKYLTRPLDRV